MENKLETGPGSSPIKLDIQSELEGMALIIREGISSVEKSVPEIESLIDMNKKGIISRLNDTEKSKLHEICNPGIEGRPPALKVGDYRFALFFRDSEAFLSMLVRATNTFLRTFFPIDRNPKHAKLWNKLDMETAYSESAWLAAVYHATIDGSERPREDLWRIASAFDEIKNRLDSSDYESESQQVQLRIAKIQLSLAESQENLAKEQREIAQNTEKQSLCMVFMTIIITIATIASLIVSVCSCSQNEPTDRQTETINLPTEPQEPQPDEPPPNELAPQRHDPRLQS